MARSCPGTGRRGPAEPRSFPPLLPLQRRSFRAARLAPAGDPAVPGLGLGLPRLLTHVPRARLLNYALIMRADSDPGHLRAVQAAPARGFCSELLPWDSESRSRTNHAGGSAVFRDHRKPRNNGAGGPNAGPHPAGRGRGRARTRTRTRSGSRRTARRCRKNSSR